jgi:hypothetical protein
MSVVFVLAPHAVVDNVLLYRSISGYFGVTGLLDLAHFEGATRVYDHAFTVAFLAGMVLLVRMTWRRGLGARRSVLLAGLLLAAVPALGPGYAPQYAYWYFPALLASYVMFDRGWRRVLVACYVVAAVDWIFEYAFTKVLGRFLVAFFTDSSGLLRFSDRVSTQAGQTLIRIPLFLAFLVLLAAGARRLRPGPDADAVRAPPPRSPADASLAQPGPKPGVG